MGSKFAACMLIYNKMVLTEWRMPTPAMQEYLKRGMLSILLCVNGYVQELSTFTSGYPKAQLPSKMKK